MGPAGLGGRLGWPDVWPGLALCAASISTLTGSLNQPRSATYFNAMVPGRCTTSNQRHQPVSLYRRSGPISRPPTAAYPASSSRLVPYRAAASFRLTFHVTPGKPPPGAYRCQTRGGQFRPTPRQRRGTPPKHATGVEWLRRPIRHS